LHVCNFLQGSQHLKQLVDRYTGGWVEAKSFETVKNFIADLQIEPLALIDFEFRKSKKED
jgi:hypothetical protein